MYLGNKKIDKIEGTTVMFKDGSKEEYTHKQLWYLVTKKAKDLTEIRNLVLENVMPEVKAVLEGEELSDVSLRIFEILESHNVTNAEFGAVLQRILMNRVEDYNNLMKEKMWDELEKYSKDIERLKELTALLSDSYNRSMYIASWIAFGTYMPWKPAETCLDDIRMSDIAKQLQTI